MNDVYACLLIAKESSIIIFFVVCSIAVAITFWKKGSNTPEEKKNG